MRILIPNATGPTNIGDQAILAGLLNLIESTYQGAEIIIHSSTPDKYGNFKYPIKPHIYFWTVFDNKSLFSRLGRASQVGIVYLSKVFGWQNPPIDPNLKDLIRDYENADIILYVGGGYLRTSRGLTQSLNLLMLLFQFFFAKFFNARKLVAPGSFGPFASSWQEKLSAAVLKNFELVSVREKVSFLALKKYGVGNLVLSSDHALLLQNESKATESKAKFLLGLTVRNWGSKAETERNVEIIVDSLVRFHGQHPDIEIRPIVQVSSIDFGDLDMTITTHLAHELKSKGVQVADSTILIDLESAIRTYGELDMVLGMRMHSNIIAATQLKPFVAIAYEHKTRGIAGMLDLSQYCLDYGKFTVDDLFSKLSAAYADRHEVVSKLRSRLEEIRRIELAIWKKALLNQS